MSPRITSKRLAFYFSILYTLAGTFYSYLVDGNAQDEGWLYLVLLPAAWWPEFVLLVESEPFWYILFGQIIMLGIIYLISYGILIAIRGKE